MDGEQFSANLEALRLVGLALNDRTRAIARRERMTPEFIRDRAADVLKRAGSGALVRALEQDDIPAPKVWTFANGPSPAETREREQEQRDQAEKFRAWSATLSQFEREAIRKEATRALPIDLRDDPRAVRSAVYSFWWRNGEPERGRLAMTA